VIDRFLKTSYARGGRGPDAYDCWGMCRDARRVLYGRWELPLLSDACPGDMRAITRAVESVKVLNGFTVVSPAPGAIATAWTARLCVHVGLVVVVDGRLKILETDEPAGPSLTALNKFQARYTRVIFYDDQDLSRANAGPAD
jgi:hypothetical protein